MSDGGEGCFVVLAVAGLAAFVVWALFQEANLGSLIDSDAGGVCLIVVFIVAIFGAIKLFFD